jgi:hypothetical protein
MIVVSKRLVTLRFRALTEEGEWVEFWEPEMVALCDLMTSAMNDDAVIGVLKANVKPRVRDRWRVRRWSCGNPCVCVFCLEVRTCTRRVCWQGTMGVEVC